MLQARLYVSRRLVAYSCGCAVLVALIAPAGVTAPLFLCSLVGIVIALDQTPGRHRHLDRCEQSAPLFGLENFILTVSPGPLPPAVVACTLTALSATTRRGATRALYVLLACAVMGGAYALAVIADNFLAELAFCVIVAFFALRQYGETLARFDPI